MKQVNIIGVLMGYLFSIAIVLIVVLCTYILMIKKRLKVLNRRIKELIKENDSQHPENSNSEICFKTDRNLNITYVNEALCHELGLDNNKIIGTSIFGSLLEDNNAVRSHIKGYINRIIKKADIINNQLVLINHNGEKKLVQCHQRPILNEILECEGISFVCRNISETQELQEKLENLKELDLLTGILNQEAFFTRLEQDFNLAKRYNRDFSLLVVELHDLCDFINKGISFERGDNLLKDIANLCQNLIGDQCFAGRFEKTKIGLILNGYTRGKAGKLANSVYAQAKPLIRTLGVDEYNAQMLILSYTERKGFNDTFDNMLERTRRHIKNAMRRHQYGVTTSDNDKKKTHLPDKFQE